MPFTAVMVNKTIHWSGETLYASCHLEFPQCLTMFRSSPVRHKQKCAVLSASNSFYKCRSDSIKWCLRRSSLGARCFRLFQGHFGDSLKLKGPVFKSLFCASLAHRVKICGTPVGWVHKTFNTMNFEERFLILWGIHFSFHHGLTLVKMGKQMASDSNLHQEKTSFMFEALCLDEIELDSSLLLPWCDSQDLKDSEKSNRDSDESGHEWWIKKQQS